jgi:endonuclease YncB( thermonuclease family)
MSLSLGKTPWRRRRFAGQRLAVLAIAAAVLATRALAVGAEVLSGPVEATVVRVVDADSLVVRARIWLDQDLETSVRLLGVDAPELHGTCEFE